MYRLKPELRAWDGRPPLFPQVVYEGARRWLEGRGRITGGGADDQTFSGTTQGLR